MKSLKDKETIDFIRSVYTSYSAHFKACGELIAITEGKLNELLISAIRAENSPQAAEQAIPRIAPINLLNKILDKIASIYNDPPLRTIEGGTERDLDQLRTMEKTMNVNTVMAEACRNFVLHKSMLLQPFAHLDKVRLRAVQADGYFVIGTDKVDPLYPTVIVTFKNMSGGKIRFSAYTAKEHVIFNSDGEVLENVMEEQGSDGENPLDALPFVYRTGSSREILPDPDGDVKAMTMVVPILLTDVNFAIKFQAFSIIYGIDLNESEIKFAPNAVWLLKKDPMSDQKPEIGQIKPQVDINAVLEAVQSEISLWLNSKGIRPGAVGSLNKDNFANGISKMIDEMDTTEIRKNLVSVFQSVEEEMWSLIIQKEVPWWINNGDTDLKEFSAGCKVVVKFPDQRPAVNRGQKVTELKAEVDAKFTTRRRAIQELNPRATDAEIEKLMQEIADDGAPTQDENASGQGGQPENQEATADESRE